MKIEEQGHYLNKEVLRVENLSKSYFAKGRSLKAVKSISLSLSQGEILAFLGSNGAGKTTAIKMMAGLIKPDSGKILISGTSSHNNPKALRYLGVTLEGSRNLYWRMTCIENLEYFGVLRGLTIDEARQHGAELLSYFALSQKINVTVQELSRGMQQRLALAVALVHRPKILLLDEPTLGLDVQATEHIKTLVKEIANLGCAILLTTHRLDIAQQLSHRVAILKDGEMIAYEETSRILKRFSGSTYSIEVENEMDRLTLEKLKKFRPEVEGLKISFSGSSTELYEVLEIIKPNPLSQVRKSDADLAKIFLKLTEEKKHV